MFKTIAKEIVAEHEVKKSRFIAYICPVNTEEEVQKIIEQLKIKWPSARHYCYAYILREKPHIERYSDDGEPSGTAGMPILDILKYSELENVVAVVIRYFGGTLLGTGGLVKAYTESVKLAIEKAQIIKMSRSAKIKIVTDYSNYGVIENECKKWGVHIKDVQFTDKVSIYLYVLIQEVDDLANLLINRTSNNIDFKIEGYEYIDIAKIKSI
ncbi:Hypothetical protein SYNTR_0648 [Candidatus Syntrophocurvum alkaliphilum]|uniref:YigZ family protein n=1 Tax=Candidatus Syntrophocurvum alkaliphilum TaxID=2293317 RepID=A0A6I6DFT0_9FIRM|nr:YigZ family protein [Candidatus Syntrophocurvum alkaliphilum]QGT99241.1 Hypothetical protein SYNTR_0648 [Candidatus Syntrophocurvum alkaliphilum]